MLYICVMWCIMDIDQYTNSFAFLDLDYASDKMGPFLHIKEVSYPTMFKLQKEFTFEMPPNTTIASLTA